MNDQLTSFDELTTDIVESGVVTFEDLVRCVQRFHYGRNENRSDFSLVWHERKGSCSSKHAFLKMMADLNDIPNVELVLCIYKMSGANTPGISELFEEFPVDYLPEAHCFLRINGEDRDVTFPNSNIDKIKQDILVEQIIQPNVVISDKLIIHQSYIHSWLKKEHIKCTFDEVWKVRESCINRLERNS